MTKETKNNPPVAKFRENGLTVSIWERRTEKGTFHDVTYERSYRDADGKWHNLSSCPANQLPTLRKLLDMAHTEILSKRAADQVDEQGETSDDGAGA